MAERAGHPGTVLGEHGGVVLTEVVATPERRARAAEIARRVLPRFVVQNDVAVQRLEPPQPETPA